MIHSDITLLTGDGVADHVTPITGYLTYGVGVRSQYISVTSIDDDIPEPSTSLVVLLSSSNNKGRITARPDSQASLTGNQTQVILNCIYIIICLVLKSDRANGEFAFSAASLMPRTSVEGDILTFEIERRGGAFGSVLVTWEVQSTMSNNDTVSDFNPSSSEAVFGSQITSEVKC